MLTIFPEFHRTLLQVIGTGVLVLSAIVAVAPNAQAFPDWCCCDKTCQNWCQFPRTDCDIHGDCLEACCPSCTS